MESTPSNTDAIVRGVTPGVNAEVTPGVSPNEWLDAWMVGWMDGMDGWGLSLARAGKTKMGHGKTKPQKRPDVGPAPKRIKRAGAAVRLFSSMRSSWAMIGATHTRLDAHKALTHTRLVRGQAGCTSGIQDPSTQWHLAHMWPNAFAACAYLLSMASQPGG